MVLILLRGLCGGMCVFSGNVLDEVWYVYVKYHYMIPWTSNSSLV